MSNILRIRNNDRLGIGIKLITMAPSIHIIKQVATDVGKAGGKPFAWMAESGTSAGPAITEIFKFITGTIIASGNAAQPVLTATDIKGVKTVDSFILDTI